MKHIFKNLLCTIIISICTLNIYAQTSKDSLLSLNKKDIVDEIRLMTKLDQYVRNYFNFKSFNKKTIDSLRTRNYRYETNQTYLNTIGGYISNIDNHNTERLIKITRKYGFPNKDRIGESFMISLIFFHANKRYFDEIARLIEIEYKSKRMNEQTYSMIKWHINGRKGRPHIKGVKVKG